MRSYEFHIYEASEAEGVARDARIETMICFDDAAAKSVGRKHAKTTDGPVDIARAGAEPWAARYVATARKAYPWTKSKATVVEVL